MFDINLVPEVQSDKQQLAKKNTYATFTAVSIIGVTLAGLIILGSLKVAADFSLNHTKNKIQEVGQESEQYKELEKAVLSLESGLLGIKDTLNGQNNWTLLLPHLEAATPSDVRYKSISIEGNTVIASLSGRNVDSIARFIDSYKAYQVLVLSGTGNPQDEVSFALNNKTYSTQIKNNGSWVLAIKISTKTDFEINASGDITGKIKYTSNNETITSEAAGVSAKLINLYSNISTKQYAKEASGVNFDSTFNVGTEALW
jgi:Tfp pilus assembly protein PilN